VEGKPLPGVSLEVAENAIWSTLHALKTAEISEQELQKVKNKIESTMLFAELSILDKAMNLAYYEALGKAEDYNHEIEKYLAVSTQDVHALANEIFRPEKDRKSTRLN